MFTYPELFELLTVYGCSIAPQLIDDGKPKNNINFKSHSLILVDIDRGMTIEQLLDDRLYRLYGSGYYSSPSHTESELYSD